MPKATRGKAENETPKKGARKAKPAEGNGTNAAEPITTAPSIADTTSKVVATEIAASVDQNVTKEKAPKKRARKAQPDEENGSAAVMLPSALVETVSQVAAKAMAEPSSPQKVMVTEELVRRRAYEIYLRRRGQGGSPEQDWFQALQEISGQHVA